MRKLKITLLLAMTFIPIITIDAYALSKSKQLNEVTSNEIMNFIAENGDDSNLVLANIRALNTKSRKFMPLSDFNKMANNNQLAAEEYDINTKSKKFDVTYKYSDISNDLRNYDIKLSGIYTPSIEIPTFRKAMSRGSIIKESDIEYISMEKRRVRRNILIDIEDIVGKELKRSLKDNTAIASSYLQKPMLVKKNDLITLHYSTRTIKIRTIGKAMENGGAEDVIRVKNLKSGLVIQAIITKNGDGIVNFKDFLQEEKTIEDGIAYSNKFKNIAG